MTQHTWRHVIFWLLLLGLVWLPLPSLTADLNKACHAKFQIRAMIYTPNFAYLVDGDGQLFVEDATTFLGGIQQKPPTIELSKPIFSLSTNWHRYPYQVDYANPHIHFGFTADHPDDDSRQDKVSLRMITYVITQNGLALQMCAYRGFQMNGREAPSSLAEDRPCWYTSPDTKPDFWLNDKWSMYPIKLDAGDMVIVKLKFKENEFLKAKKWNADINTRIGTLTESNVKPQSGLLTENVIFIASQDSTGHFLSVDKEEPTYLEKFNPFGTKQLGINSKKWQLSEVIKLLFCQIETPVEPKVEPEVEPKVEPKVESKVDLPFTEGTIVLSDPRNDSIKDSVKPTPPKRKILYLALAGTLVLVLALAVYGMMNWWKKKKKPTRKRKNGDKDSKKISFWSKIRALIDKVSPCSSREKEKTKKTKRMVSKVRESRASSMASDISSAEKKIRKRDKASKKGDSKTTSFCGTIGGLLAKVCPCMAKRKRREIVPSNVRESILLTSMAAAASKASPSLKRRKKGGKVGPTSRASPRSAVSGALSELQKGLLGFKALMRHPKPKLKLFSTASTASTASPASTATTASLASLASLPAETQSLDYHF